MEMTVKQQMFLNCLRQLRTAMDSVEADLNAFVSMSERWNHAALSEIMGLPEELINDSNIDHHNYLVSSGIVERVEYMFREWQEGGNDVLMDCDKVVKEAKDNGMWLFLHKVKSVGIKTDVLRKLDSALIWYEGSYNRMVYSVTHGTADLYGLSRVLDSLEDIELSITPKDDGRNKADEPGTVVDGSDEAQSGSDEAQDDSVSSDKDKYEKLKDYFKSSYKGMDNSKYPKDYLQKFLENYEARKWTGIEIAAVALLMYGCDKAKVRKENTVLNSKRPGTFKEWYEKLCECLGESPKQYKPNAILNRYKAIKVLAEQFGLPY